MTIGKSVLLVATAFGAVFNSVAFSRMNSIPSSQASSANVSMVTDEVDAALAILAKTKAGQPITDSDWRRLFSSEGYVRLKKRETSMQRPFEDREFAAFILSDKLVERATALQDTLNKWTQADTTGAARRAFAYLPPGSRFRARIYPMIKPRENSFVFEVNTDPAIFLYLDPEVTSEQFENTLAHELHHIGYGGSCPRAQTKREMSRLPRETQAVINWIGAFGEGFAMLAAAGGPDIHPHAASKPDDRARWDRDVSNFNDDLKKVEAFFGNVLAGKLSKQDEERLGFSFFGVQGPWYTLGWKMAVTIERVYGRARLIECMCDHQQLLSTFNRAASQMPGGSPESLSTWSEATIRAVSHKPDSK